MTLFVKVMFWAMLICFIIRLLELAFRSYPYSDKITMGRHVAGAIERLAWLLWAGIVLWMR